VLQTCEWAETKARNGWEPIYAVWRGTDGAVQAAALILERTLRLGGFAARLRIHYIPRGPLLDWQDTRLRGQVLDDLQAFSRRKGAIFLKIDPEVPLGMGIPGGEGLSDDPLGLSVQNELSRRGWQFSESQVQFRNTVVVDLSPTEEDLLARMKQKSRYNIRLAERKGVRIRTGSTADLPLLYRMYAETAVRDGFVIREEGYYRSLWERFIRAGKAEPLIAEVEAEPVAAVIIFRFAGKAWYLFGMSRQAHREKMPNALLQWEAMRRAKAHDCQVYDLWGAPDVFDENDPLWGVFRFKEGLGGQVLRTLGAWDFPVNPLFFQIYTRTLPRILDVMRRRGRARTQQEVQPL